MEEPEVEGGQELHEPASAATSSGDEASSPPGDPLAAYFVRHKISKHDTLAGLAVKYNVTVSDIKRANGFLADTAMFAKDTLLIPTRPLPVGPEYSTWAGMIVTHYGRLGPSDDLHPPSDSPYAHFSQARQLQQLRGYYSMGPSRSQSPQYGSGAEDGDRHHLYAGGGDWGQQRRGGTPQQVELMERAAPAATATYIEDRLRRRGRGDSQGDEQPPAGSSQAAGEPGGTSAHGSGSGGGHLAAVQNLLQHRPALFGPEGAALAAAGGQKLRHWKESLLSKLKKVASQPSLAAPPGAAPGLQELGAAAVASAPLSGSTSARGSGASPARGSMRQRGSSSGGTKAD